MRNSYFSISVIALTVFMLRIAATPVIATIEQSVNLHTITVNKIVKRQFRPSCSHVCGGMFPQHCLDILDSIENGPPLAQFCSTETFSAPTGEDCNYSYKPPSDGTCLSHDDLLSLMTGLRTCLGGPRPSGGCIDGARGSRVCMFSNESPCA